jgi:hypothetical protein
VFIEHAPRVRENAGEEERQGESAEPICEQGAETKPQNQATTGDQGPSSVRRPRISGCGAVCRPKKGADEC